MVSDNVVSTSNWSNFGRLSRRAGLSAIAGLSCFIYYQIIISFLQYKLIKLDALIVLLLKHCSRTLNIMQLLQLHKFLHPDTTVSAPGAWLSCSSSVVIICFVFIITCLIE